MVTEITDSTFEAEVLKAQGLVIVDFWAVWCGPCRALSPSVDAIAEEFAGKVKVCKCDIDANQQVPVQLGIRSIPTLLFFKDGNLVDKSIGAVSKSTLVDLVNKNL